MRLIFAFAFAFIPLYTFAQKADTTIAKSALLKYIAQQHEQASKEFQYSLTPEQRELQDKIKFALVMHEAYQRVEQDSIRVKK